MSRISEESEESETREERGKQMPLTDNTRNRISSFFTNPLWDQAPERIDYFGGIIGGEEPSRYSASPHLWNSLFRALDVAGYFTALDLPRAEQLPDVLAFLSELTECVDITVTSPYKSDAWDAVQQLPRRVEVADRVRRLGCLNHVIPDHAGARLFVDNTDGQGMLRALQKRKPLSGARVLLVGAGGAAASIGYELAAAGTGLTIANIIAEDAAKLQRLLEPLVQPPGRIRSGGWELVEQSAGNSDIIVSAITVSTPLSAQQIAGLPPDCLCADTRYGANGLFAAAAREAGRPSVDGREMLFGQFELAAERVGELLVIEQQKLSRALADIEREFT